MKVRQKCQPPRVFIKNSSADCGFDSENQSKNSSFLRLFPVTPHAWVGKAKGRYVRICFFKKAFHTDGITSQPDIIIIAIP